jgi:phage repressor protein C with HTH and peptisase S24 domain
MICDKQTSLQAKGEPFKIIGMKLKDRLKAARSHAGLSQTQLANQVGIKQASVSEIERGLSKNSGHLVKMARVCGVSPAWLAEGIGEMLEIFSPNSNMQGGMSFLGGLESWDDATHEDHDEVEIPLYSEVAISAGDGRTRVIEDRSARLRFSRRILNRAKVPPEHAGLAYVSGSSMEPALTDGSVVGIDKKDVTIKDGKIYALDHEGMLRFRQVSRLPGGGIRLRAFDVAEHPDEDYGPGWPEKIRIIGRVFWSSTMW